MDPTRATAMPSAQPRPVKAIGFMNLAIGTLLFFCGTSFVDSVFPAFTTYEPIAIDAHTVQELYDRLRRGRIEDLRTREQEEKSEPLRASIRRERLAVEAERIAVTDQIDFARI